MKNTAVKQRGKGKQKDNQRTTPTRYGRRRGKLVAHAPKGVEANPYNRLPTIMLAVDRARGRVSPPTGAYPEGRAWVAPRVAEGAAACGRCLEGPGAAGAGRVANWKVEAGGRARALPTPLVNTLRAEQAAAPAHLPPRLKLMR